jgi:hypothetical protein
MNMEITLIIQEFIYCQESRLKHTIKCLYSHLRNIYLEIDESLNGYSTLIL